MAKTKISPVKGKYTSTLISTVGTSDTIIPFNTLVDDQYSLYNTSTGILTASEAGTIDIVAAFSTLYSAAAHDVAITLYKNGILITDNLRTMVSGSGGRGLFSDSIVVAINDQLTIRCRCSVATTINGSAQQNYFTFAYRR